MYRSSRPDTSAPASTGLLEWKVEHRVQVGNRPLLVSWRHPYSQRSASFGQRIADDQGLVFGEGSGSQSGVSLQPRGSRNAIRPPGNAAPGRIFSSLVSGGVLSDQSSAPNARRAYDAPVNSDMSAGDWLSEYAQTLKWSAQDLAALFTDDIDLHWKAYCEFVYAIVFVCVGALLKELLVRGVRREKAEAMVFAFDRGVLTALLIMHGGVPGVSDQGKLYRDHHDVLEQRAEQWASMPTFGPTASMCSEVPKQAARAALGDEQAAAPMLQKASLQLSQCLASIPVAMEHCARTLLSDRPKPV